MSDNVSRLTKRYIIDMMNATFFSEQVSWSGIDQFHQLPVIDSFDNELCTKTEVRGVVLVNRKMKTAIKMVIIMSEDIRASGGFKVCYRFKSLEKQSKINENLFYPLSQVRVDISAADLNLGLQQDSAYCFSVNNNPTDESKHVSCLLSFIINSELVESDDKGVFDEFFGETDLLNYPPCVGDNHYKPVFASYESKSENYLK